MRIDIKKLPAFAEFDEVPYIVFETGEGITAMSHYGSTSGLLPEILFEGDLITRERFIKLAKQWAVKSKSDEPEKYKEVLHYFDELNKLSKLKNL